jgi:anti-sigma regulatory factor (Ser/Thr protein kinase)
MRETAIFRRPEEEEIHITSGNKYLFEGYRSILEISQKQLGEVQIKGIEALRNIALHRIVYFPDGTVESARKLDEKKIDVVSKLINEITVNLESVGYDPITYKEKAMEWGIGLEEVERLSQFFEIDSIERPIANEISFLYYLNLNDEWYFHIINDSLERTLYPRPLWCLLAIFKEDTEIREWFSKLIWDIVKYQEKELQSMREFNDRISHFDGNTGVYEQPAGNRIYKGIQKGFSPNIKT